MFFNMFIQVYSDAGISFFVEETQLIITAINKSEERLAFVCMVTKNFWPAVEIRSSW